MLTTQRCQYALRAIFEVAKRNGEGLIKNAEIARAQAIPPRFLEAILAELKQAGWIESRKGRKGGYLLARPAGQITVGDVVRLMEGDIGPVECLDEPQYNKCPLNGRCVFLPVWKRVHEAISGICDAVTIEDLVDEERKRESQYVPRYAI